MSPNPPLFTSDRQSSSSHSEERAAQEDTALLGSQRNDDSNSQKKYRFWRELGLFTWAVVATAAVIVLAVYSQHQGSHEDGKTTAPKGKKNLIFMVSDGMGPASLSMTRSFRQFQSMEFLSFPRL
jgi:alkaline phosphatase